MGRPRRPRGYMVLVMGAPGRRLRRFRVGRAAVIAATATLLAVVGASAAVGYNVAASRRVGATQPASGPEGQRKAPSPGPESAPAGVKGKAPAHAATRPQPEPEPPADKAAAAGTEGPPSDAILRLLPRRGAEVVELHPFTTAGEPRASAFRELAALLACGDDEGQTPSPRLVHALLRAQEQLGRPALVLGGRCPAHRDRDDARRLHRSGRAIDVRLRGVSTRRLMDFLVEQGAGGVGRYPRRGFVHLDVRDGPPEHWENEPEEPPQEASQAEPAPPPRKPPQAAPTEDRAPAATRADPDPDPEALAASPASAAE